MSTVANGAMNKLAAMATALAPDAPAEIAHSAPHRRGTPMRGNKSKRPRRWHEQRAHRILSKGAAQSADDYDAWFRHIAYGDGRPNTPHPNPEIRAKEQAQIEQIVAGRRARDAERLERNARRKNAKQVAA